MYYVWYTCTILQNGWFNPATKIIFNNQIWKDANWLIILSNTHNFGSNFLLEKKRWKKSCCSIFFTCLSSILIWWLLYNDIITLMIIMVPLILSQCIRCFDRKLHISITISKRRPGHKTPNRAVVLGWIYVVASNTWRWCLSCCCCRGMRSSCIQASFMTFQSKILLLSLMYCRATYSFQEIYYTVENTTKICKAATDSTTATTSTMSTSKSK